MAWLVMAAIPFQGLAAATMAFCGGAHHAQAAQVGAGGMHEHADGTAHDHGQPVADAQAIEAESAATASKALPDVNHKCGACTSCCSSVAIAQSAYDLAFAPVPQAGLAEPFVLIHAPPSQLPDKPPRA